MKKKAKIAFILCAFLLAGCSSTTDRSRKKEKKNQADDVVCTNKDLLKMTGYREGVVVLTNEKINVPQQKTEYNRLYKICYRAFEKAEIKVTDTDRKTYRKLASDVSTLSSYETLKPLTEHQKKQMPKTANDNEVKKMLFTAAVIKREKITLNKMDMENGFSKYVPFASLYKIPDAQMAAKKALKMYCEELGK